jgi:predicted nuclease of restriction endonuclease-like (RecB) superfamily
MAKNARKSNVVVRRQDQYAAILAEVVELLESARRTSARAVNAVMTVAYWQVGRRIVESEQGGASRAGYGERLLERLSEDLTKRFDRGFSTDNLELMRRFYLAYEAGQISETASRKFRSMISETPSIGRQRRLRVGDTWYRIDLLLFHRRLRCLVLIDLKTGKFTHGDAGQMHLYCNYAKEHWTHPDENPPVGLILCTDRNDAVARYSLEGLPNKIMVARYKTALPDEKLIAEELERNRKLLESRRLRSRRPR